MVCNLTQVNNRSSDMNPTMSAKKVGTNMVLGDVVEGKSACPFQERSVDGRDSTADERPLLLKVINNCRV